MLAPAPAYTQRASFLSPHHMLVDVGDVGDIHSALNSELPGCVLKLFGNRHIKVSGVEKLMLRSLAKGSCCTGFAGI